MITKTPIPTKVNSCFDETESYPSNRLTGSFQINTFYTNFTRQNLFIKTQNNIPICVDNNNLLPHPRDQKVLLITTEYVFNTPSVFTGTKELIAAFKENKIHLPGIVLSIYEKMVEKVQHDINRLRRNRTFNFSVTHEIPEDELLEKGVIHFRETDVIIGLTKEHITKPHPNSTLGLNQQSIESNAKLHGFSGTFVRVIDNERMAPSYFYHSGKKVIEVPAEVNVTMESGVYIRTLTGNREIDTVYMSFEEAKAEIGLYKTKDEAVSAGDPESLIRQRTRELDAELARVNQENKQIEAENMRLKQAFTRDDLYMKNESQRREAELKEKHSLIDDYTKLRDAKYAKKKAKLQQKVEKASIANKMLDAFLKSAPILIGIGTLFFGAFKLSKA